LKARLGRRRFERTQFVILQLHLDGVGLVDVALEEFLLKQLDPLVDWEKFFPDQKAANSDCMAAPKTVTIINGMAAKDLYEEYQ